MRKPDRIEAALDRLSVLRSSAPSPASIDELRKALGNKSNLVVAKAAKIAGESQAAELAPDLAAAFNRLMANPADLDAGCAALTEIAVALYTMDYTEPEVYLRGLRHVQMEGSYGPPVDAAAKLRAQCALGLVRTRYRDALFAVLNLLVDPEPHARIGAVRAFVSVGSETAELLLRLKAISGDEEPEVIGECLAGLLETMPERSVPFVATFADSANSDIAEAAILALGSSRRPEAFEILKTKWERTVRGPLRKTLLVAMAGARLEEASAYIASLLETGSPHVATEILMALAVYRRDERVRQIAEAAILRRGDPALTAVWQREFRP